MITSVTLKAHQVEIQSNKGLRLRQFKETLRDYQYTADRVVILTDVHKGMNPMNIYCLDDDGELIWHVHHTEQEQKRRDLIIPKEKQTPFISISQPDDKVLEAYNWDSFVYKIDMLTGTIFHAKFTK